MHNLRSFLEDFKGKSLLAVFPHADDVSFVAGGLMQLLQEIGISTKLVCLTGDKNLTETGTAASILGIDEVVNFNLNSLELGKTKKQWLSKLSREILSYKPDIILTFDPHGVTGHPDHVASSIEILNFIKRLSQKPVLMWRVADQNERNHFDRGHNIHINVSPSHKLNLSLSQSIKKLKAIFAHKNKFKSLLFKMRVTEWYLFDHKELYYQVDLRRDKYNLAIKNMSLLK